MISSYAKYNTRAGDIFFFYRPKVRSGKVESIEYDRRFFMVLEPEAKNWRNKTNIIIC